MYHRFLKNQRKINNSIESESIKKKLIYNPEYNVILIQMNEVLLNSMPQLFLQSYLLYKDYKGGELQYLEFWQIESIVICLTATSLACMSFNREIAFNRIKINRIRPGRTIFKICRFLSNLLFLISRTVPIVFLMYHFIWVLLIVLGKVLIQACFVLKFEISDYDSNNKPVNNIKKASIAILFSLIKNIAFFEEIEFTRLSCILSYLIIFIENLVIYGFYLYLSSYSIYDFVVIIKLIFILIWFPLGFLIEIIYWKILNSKCCRKRNKKEKLSVENISQNVFFFNSLFKL
jgi:hypothetical protein